MLLILVGWWVNILYKYYFCFSCIILVMIVLVLIVFWIRNDIWIEGGF